jgi:D-sedoheptulose 7-phosphate isomerase
MLAVNTMTDNEFFDDYFARYRRSLFETDVRPELLAFRDLCLEIKRRDGKLMFAGNGASASIASHAAVDFTKQAKVRALAFNDHNLITAFSNDYGYENWVAEAVKAYGKTGDAVVLISSSGKSPNIVSAALAAKDLGLKVVTFSGFEKNNPLSTVGDINLWVESRAYNIIEAVHGVWMFAVVDLLVGSAEYGVK